MTPTIEGVGAPTRTKQEAAAIAVWMTLIGVAALWGQLLVNSDPRVKLPAAPLFGRFELTIDARFFLPVAVGAGVLWLMPRAALKSRRYVLWSCVAAVVWALALGFASRRGLSGALGTRADYLSAVPAMPSPADFLRTFTSSIADYPLHVEGHPPGFPLVLWVMSRLGMPGVGWATALIVLAGASIPGAVLLVLREVSGGDAARRAAPFVALAPAAIWIVSSGDAVFAAAGAWATALLVLSARRRDRVGDLLGFGGGLVAGAGLYVSYGLAPLMVLPVVLAVYLRARRSLALMAAGVAVVAATFTLLGFWWFGGLAATRVRYLLGVSQFRPYSYSLVGNLAALAIAAGPAVAVGLATLRKRSTWLILGPVLAAVMMANLSGLSKGEVERIWLPFAVWLPVAGSAIAGARRRPWLAAQAVWAIAIQVFVVEPW